MVLSHRLCSHAQHSLHRGLRSAWSRTPCTSKPFQHEESLYNGISQCPAHPGGSSCPPPQGKLSILVHCCLQHFFSFFFFLKHVLRLLLKHRNTEQLKTSTSFAFLSDLFTASSQNPLTQFGCLKGKKKKREREGNETEPQNKQTNKERNKSKERKTSEGGK